MDEKRKRRNCRLRVRPKWLSPRMIAALKGIAQGKTRTELADEMGISMSTLKTHLERAYDRLGAHNAPEAISRARLRGLDIF